MRRPGQSLLTVQTATFGFFSACLEPWHWLSIAVIQTQEQSGMKKSKPWGLLRLKILMLGNAFPGLILTLGLCCPRPVCGRIPCWGIGIFDVNAVAAKTKYLVSDPSKAMTKRHWPFLQPWIYSAVLTQVLPWMRISRRPCERPLLLVPCMASQPLARISSKAFWPGGRATCGSWDYTSLPLSRHPSGAKLSDRGLQCVSAVGLIFNGTELSKCMLSENLPFPDIQERESIETFAST